ncbi:DUF1090 domain-containing protein [Pseudomonas sp. Marseille-QA0892]
MKHLVYVAMAMAFPGIALGADNPRCAEKVSVLSEKIETAKEAGHSHKAEGMTKALSRLRANCTDASLAKEQRQAVAEAKAKVSEREAELQEEKATGDARKVAKRQAKLDEAKAELREAEADLAR